MSRVNRGARDVSTIDTPMNRVRPLDPAKTCQSPCPSTRSAAIGTSMASASVVSNIPTMKKMGRKSTTSSSLVATRPEAASPQVKRGGAPPV